MPDIYWFVSCEYGVRRDLHSFPTRRSSDLLPVAPEYRDYVEWLDQKDLSREESFWREELRNFDSPTALRISTARSEEHTSELQSRRDLVCRLLLEKKNYQTLNTATLAPYYV